MDKTVLITGASRGIGRACAIMFSMKGYNVALNCNNSLDSALELKNLIINNGGKAQVYRADVSDCSAVKRMVSDVIDDFGSVYALVNNAGVSLSGVFTDISDDQWKRLCDINISGSIYAAQAVLPHMLSAKRGRIINISSIWGVHGASCEVHYSVSKAAVIGLTKALSKEYAGCGITVNCIAPGAVDTDMMKEYNEHELEEIKNRIPSGRLARASDIANAALFLADRESDYITGQVLGVDGGFM